MKETTLNGYLKNSLNSAFPDHMDAIKYHGGRFGISGMPDIQGCIRGINFNIEGKMLKFSRKHRFTIAKRDGNKSGCSDKQRERMKKMERAGSLVMMAYYKHYGDKGVFLIPWNEIESDSELDEFMSKDYQEFDRYWCPYVKGKVYDVKQVFGVELMFQYLWNAKQIKADGWKKEFLDG